MKKEACPVCGRGPLVREVLNETFEYKGRSITIPDYVVYKCPDCGESIVDRVTLKKSGSQLKDFQREVDGLLSGTDIRRIRAKLNLTQEQMSEILGGGIKAFTRYELGAVSQSKAMDNLLRILDKFPNVLGVIMKASDAHQERKVLEFAVEQRYVSKQAVAVITDSESLEYGT